MQRCTNEEQKTNITLAPVDDCYIKAKVYSGHYENAEEAVRDAVRRMREQDAQHSRLLAALEIGACDVAAGRTVPYTPELLNQIEQEARIHAASYRPMNPDVVFFKRH